MARRGRPRKDRDRQPNGHLCEIPRNDRPSDAHIAALGANPEDRRIHCVVEARRIAAGAKPRDERVSTPLGMMLALGLLNKIHKDFDAETLYRAGELYEKNQLRLGRHVGPPELTRTALAMFLAEAAPAVYAGMGEENDDFAKQYRRCRWVEREITARVWDWRGLEDFVVRQEAPEFFTMPGSVRGAHRLKTLQHDLVEVARFYEKPPEREMMQPRLRRVR